MFIMNRAMALATVCLMVVLVGKIIWNGPAKPVPVITATVEKHEINIPEFFPIEDLMREHGILNRLLLIYEACSDRIHRGKRLDARVLVDAATIMRNFIEDHHEKLEEEYIFPRFEKDEKLGALVKTLRKQHQLGRTFTDYIKKMAHTGKFKNPEKARLLIRAIKHFVAMYRVHESREDTELFPEFYKLISIKEYKKLGDIFEEREHKLLGKDGFKAIVVKVTKLEKELGIYDLAKFLPRVEF